ncbi:MAG TPA: MinD/ParA family protein [Polyangia bacterium]|nr:MinD/ParA family protein [Polyangia bacterium]
MADQADSLRSMAADGRLTRPALKVFAVTSGKGGVGKSNVAANLAIHIAKTGKRVLVIDADLGLANIEILFGLKPRFHLGDVLGGGRPINEVLVQGPHGICLLPAGSGIQSLTQLSDNEKRQFITALDPLEDLFDVVFIDSGAGIGDNVLFFVGAAQEAILVVNPEPTALIDAYAVVKVLSQQAGVQSFSVIVNPVVDELAARGIFNKLTTVTNRFLTARMRHLGYIPRDENFHRAIMAQRPLVDMFPSSPASRALGDIAVRLLDGPPASKLDGGLKVMWQRLLRESAPPAG